MQAAAGQYDTALLSYGRWTSTKSRPYYMLICDFSFIYSSGRALQLQPSDISILNAAKKVASLSNEETRSKIFK